MRTRGNPKGQANKSAELAMEDDNRRKDCNHESNSNSRRTLVSISSETESERFARSREPSSSVTDHDGKASDTKQSLSTPNCAVEKSDNRQLKEQRYMPATEGCKSDQKKSDSDLLKFSQKKIRKLETGIDNGKSVTGDINTFVELNVDTFCQISTTENGKMCNSEQPVNDIPHIPRKRLRSEVVEEELWDGLQAVARSRKYVKRHETETQDRHNIVCDRIPQPVVVGSTDRIAQCYSQGLKSSPLKLYLPEQNVDADVNCVIESKAELSEDNAFVVNKDEQEREPRGNIHWTNDKELPYKKRLRCLSDDKHKQALTEKGSLVCMPHQDSTWNDKPASHKKASPYYKDELSRDGWHDTRPISSVSCCDENTKTLIPSDYACAIATRSVNSATPVCNKVSKLFESSMPVCEKAARPMDSSGSNNKKAVKSFTTTSYKCDTKIKSMNSTPACITPAKSKSSTPVCDKLTENIASSIQSCDHVIESMPVCSRHISIPGHGKKIESTTLFIPVCDRAVKPLELTPTEQDKAAKSIPACNMEVTSSDSELISMNSPIEESDKLEVYAHLSSHDHSERTETKCISPQVCDSVAKSVIDRLANQVCANIESMARQTRASSSRKPSVVEKDTVTPHHQKFNSSSPLKKSLTKRSLLYDDIPTTPKRSERLQNKKVSTPTNKNIDCFIYPSLKKMECSKLDDHQTTAQTEDSIEEMKLEPSDASKMYNKNLPLKKRLKVDRRSMQESPKNKVLSLESPGSADFFQKVEMKFHSEQDKLSGTKQLGVSLLKCNEKNKEATPHNFISTIEDIINEKSNKQKLSAPIITPPLDTKNRPETDREHQPCEFPNPVLCRTETDESSFVSQESLPSQAVHDINIQSKESLQITDDSRSDVVLEDIVDNQNLNKKKKEKTMKSNKLKKSSDVNSSSEKSANDRKTKSVPKSVRRKAVDKSLIQHTGRRGYDAERFDKLVNDPILDKHACVLWSSEHRRHYQQAHPDADQCEIDNLMRKAWDRLEKKDKVRYFQRAQAALRDENKHSYVRKPRKTDKKHRIVEVEEDDGITLDISQTDSSETFQRAVRKFTQLSSHDQDVKLRKTMNLFRQLLPQNIIFKLTTELKKVIKAFVKDPQNKGVSKKDLNSGCRKILFEKLEIMKPKIIESQEKEQNKKQEDIAAEFNQTLRQMIAGESVHFTERAKVESLTPTLLDLKELESCGKLNVSGIVRSSPSYETLLEDLKKPREYSRPIIDKTIKILRFKSPIQENCKIQDSDLSQVNPSILDNFLCDVNGQDIPVIEGNTVDKFFVDNSCQPFSSQQTKETKLSDNFMKMIKIENQYRPENGSNVDEYIGRHFHDRATISYNRFVGHGSNCCHEHTSPACILSDCLVSERFFSMARQSHGQGRRSVCAPRRNEFSASNEIYIRLNGPGSLDNKAKEETKNKDTSSDK